MNKRLLFTSAAFAALLASCQQQSSADITTLSTNPKADTTTQAATTQTQTTEATRPIITDKKDGLADTTLGDYIIVNKKHRLSADYNKGEDPIAGQKVRELIHAMQQQGFAINNSYSGFRSYEYQTTLYNNYVATDGKAAADTYSARPGYSEHQTGLAFDILTTSGDLLDETQDASNTAAVEWLHAHMHDYGFVLRFPLGKDAITGYHYEPWHVRYVGDISTDIYQSGLTLEEYFNVEGGDYAN